MDATRGSEEGLEKATPEDRQVVDEARRLGVKVAGKTIEDLRRIVRNFPRL